jgi:hypothetical protein
MQPSLPLGIKCCNNQGLFADHYLEDPERLRALDEWKQVSDVQEKFHQIKQLYDKCASASLFIKRTNEAQTENEFIRPILNILWGSECYQVQVPIPNIDGSRWPDYAFFQSGSDCQKVQSQLGTIDYWRDVLVLGDAKKWSASLDKERGVDDNPSTQICLYLYRSNVRWGILTNGRIWRLYEREKSRAGGIYYEIDLEELLYNSDLESFKYFYLFFRREAFIPDTNGVYFVGKVYQESIDHATEVSDRLKESVYDALRLLMNGFLERESNGLDRHNPEILKLVHENCLIILYRLLFLLYAEDRNLLPCENKPYADYSLLRIHKEANEHLRNGKNYLSTSHRLWNDVMDLFGLIDNGSQEGSIPAYNGGLFSPLKYPHIAHIPQSDAIRWEIGDNRIAEVIDMLAYQRDQWDKPGDKDIDYNTLDVQHLGGIYEGLLELQPHIADEPMVETTEDGKSVFKPASEVPNLRPIHRQPPRTIKTGEVYLVTNRGERKATGSYYTPKYIVDYIIDNTVGRLAEEASKKAAELRPEVDKGIKELEKNKKKWQNTSGQSVNKHIDDLNSLIQKQKRLLLEPYLSLKILDPAIGSGHFLVGASDFLSLAMATDPNLLPIDEIDSEDPQAFYKRLTVERCLYGVDLNPLSVELAKLSLWLHTVSKDKALSFLDHHLRCGNSLIGARIEDDLTTIPPELDARGNVKRRETKQMVFGFTETLTARHLQHFLDTFKEIMETPSSDAVTERRKDELYRIMDSTRDKFREVASCWIAPYFGVPVTPEQYGKAVNALKGTDTDWNAITQEKWFQSVQSIAHEKRFFHWELEFPEVFFDAHGFKPKEERGFDAVIGNPPWGAEFDSMDQSYCSKRFNTGQSSQLESYAIFMECAIKHLRHIRQLGYITPDTGLRKDDLIYLRNELFNRTLVQQFVETGPLFSEVPVTWCLITIATKSDDFTENHKIQHLQINRFIDSINERLSLFAASKFSRNSTIPQSYWYKRPNQIVGYLSSELEQGIIIKIEAISIKLGEMKDQFSISRGEEGSRSKLKSDLNMEWKIILPEHIDRYSVDDGMSTLYELLTFNKVANYYSHPKIWITRIRNQKLLRRLIASFDGRKTSGAMKTLQVIVSTTNSLNSLMFLNILICSKLLNFWSVNYLVDDMNQTYLENLPIRRIEFTTPPVERTQLLEEGKGLYEHYLSSGNSDSMMEFIQNQLGSVPCHSRENGNPCSNDKAFMDSHLRGNDNNSPKTPERSDVIHDILAFLAEQMIEMNKQKQAEVKGFLTWLERTIGASVDGLKNKTKIQDYHDYDLNTIIDVLKQNKRNLSIDPNARNIQEQIEGEFSQSISKLAPLKQRITNTDRLIDQIVYRLYGLTDEEIAIVEETN